jgi:tRNA-uridine 2-sulfurtransferase
MKRVVVGLSGGVDSSVSAYLLQEQGYEVIGVFMRNWHDETVTLHDECPWIEDSNDALMVAEKLNIPFQVLDLSVDYKERIVDYMFAEYEAGRTPNPDVLCNREIKFDIFLKAALDLGADYVATGHYCQKNTIVKEGKEIHRLISGADTNKDQSYFLCQLTQEQLSKALFPIGHLQKAEVRQIAKEQGLVTAEKKDSQGLCFIGKVRLPDFLQQQLAPKTGNIVEIPNDFHTFFIKKNTLEDQSTPYNFKETDGKKVGEHFGAHYFTIGQRKGLQVGGTPEPLFVIATDVATNTIYVGQGEKHLGLYRKALFIQNSDIHFIRPDLKLNDGETATYEVRIRYRQALQKATLHKKSNGLYVEFETPQKGITAGQFAAWYSNGELIGSGAIN